MKTTSYVTRQMRRGVETARWGVSKGETFQQNVSTAVIHPASREDR